MVMGHDSLNLAQMAPGKTPTGIPPAGARSRKTIRYLLPVIYIIGDIGGIYGSFFLAYRLRFYSFIEKIFPAIYGVPDLTIYLYALIFVCMVWIFIFAVFGQY